MENTPIPVTIITGFLGAGKTTVLNNILKNYNELKILIIENEVGEINIDGSLLKKGSNNSIYELTNGCICCSLKTELGTVLNSIIMSKIKHDYMLIEATGIADPEEIVMMFNGKRVQKYFKLDGVISIVDASLFLTQHPLFPEIRKQVALSDMVLINKTDLITPDVLSEVKIAVQSINPLANIEQCTFGNTSYKALLHNNAHHPKEIEKTVTDFSSIAFAPKHSIQPVSIVLEKDFDMEKISKWLEAFLNDNSKNILRIKGVLSINGMKHKIILQSVGNQFQVYQGAEWDDEARINRLVFIGTGLDKNEILNTLNTISPLLPKQ